MKIESPFRFSTLLVLVVFGACALAEPAFAQSEKRIALVIGNGAYRFNNTLKNPPNDAADMASALKRDGFQVTLLTDASRDAMEKSVRAFGTSLKDPDAVGLFYYSGHGAQADGQNYLLPVDSDIQDADELRYKAMDAESILAKMRSAGNKLNIVVLDACRNNPFPGSSRSGEKGLAIVKVKVPDSVIVFATDPGSTAEDGSGRNSPFTAAFMAVMEKPGMDIAVMMKQVTGRVQAETGGKQTPWVSTNLTKDFAFVPGGRTAPAPQSTTAPVPRAPTLTVTRVYGSLLVTAATAGSLYLDGRLLGDIPAGAEARLDNVEAGDRTLELHYAEGRVEQHTATVESGAAATVAFTYREGGPAPESGSSEQTGAGLPAEGQSGSSQQTAELFRLAKNGSPEDIQATIRKGANVNAQDENYLSPLRLAAAYNTNPEVIKVLVDAGADVNTPDYAQFTPLMYAASRNQNPEVIAALLDAGADPKAANGMGKTAFDYAQANEKLKGSDAFQKLASASAQPPAAEEIQPKPPVVAAKDSLQSGDPLPQASIKIDGKFDDWEDILPAFLNPYTSKGNLGIRRAFLARDDKTLYVKMEIADDTRSWLLHPDNFNREHRTVYGVFIGDRTFNINLNVYYDPERNTWHTDIGGGPVGDWKRISSLGNWAMKGSSMEAGFPLASFAKYVAPGGSYMTSVYTCYNEGNKVVTVDSPQAKQLQF